jgi:hypothetical protein
MSSLLDMIFQQIGGNNLNELGRKIGTDERSTGGLISAALPLLVSALARNSSSDEGAEALSSALSRDHDGTILDNLTDFLGRSETEPGDGILRHVLGNRRETVETGLSRSSGVDTQSVGKALALLAPIVMGALGKTKRENNLDARSLSGYLGQEREEMERSEPNAMGALGRLLDADGDGDVDAGDIANQAFRLFGRFFGGSS